MPNAAADQKRRAVSATWIAGVPAHRVHAGTLLVADAWHRGLAPHEVVMVKADETGALYVEHAPGGVKSRFPLSRCLCRPTERRAARYIGFSLA